MSTVIRSELSKKNPYWIEKHRYYELKHFCLQYPRWKKMRAALSMIGQHPTDTMIFSNEFKDPTSRYAQKRVYYSERMEMVERAAEETDHEIGAYILEGVTKGISYDILKTNTGVPCCRETYYKLYRRFFWILSQIRK